MTPEKIQKTQTNFLALFALGAFFFGVYSMFNLYSNWSIKRCIQNPVCIARIESAIAADNIKAEQASGEAEPANFEIKSISQQITNP